MAPTKQVASKSTGEDTLPARRTVLWGTSGKVKKPRKYRAGSKSSSITRVINNSNTEQPALSVGSDVTKINKQLFNPKISLQELAREIAADIRKDSLIQGEDLGDLEKVVEPVVKAEFEMAKLVAIHDKRDTILEKDMELVRVLKSMMVGQ